MDQNMSFTQNLDALFSNLEDFTRNESVLGKPLVHEGKTLIPIISVTVGYGSGNAPQKNQQASTGMAGMMQGNALGLGAKVTTEAVVLFDNNNVQMLPVSGKGMSQSMMDKLPQMFSSLSGQQGQGQNQSQNQNQTPGQG